MRLTKELLKIYSSFDKEHEDFKKVYDMIDHVRITFEKDLLKATKHEIYVKEDVEIDEEIKEFDRKHVKVIVKHS